MCGIVAAVSPAANIVPVLLEGLRKLEYRGYDSAGIAVLNGAGVQRVRTAGRVAELTAASEGVAAHAPMPAPMARRAGRARAQLLVEAAARGPLHAALRDWLPAMRALRSARRVRWSLDVDPVDLY